MICTAAKVNKMDEISLKIAKTSPRQLDIIKLVREYDASFSLGEIKNSIQNGSTVVCFDPYSGDLLDEMNGVDVREKFLKLVNGLLGLGADITLERYGDELAPENLGELLRDIDERN